MEPGSIDDRLLSLAELVVVHDADGLGSLALDPAFWQVLDELQALRPEDSSMNRRASPGGGADEVAVASEQVESKGKRPRRGRSSKKKEDAESTDADELAGSPEAEQPRGSSGRSGAEKRADGDTDEGDD